MKRTGMGKMVLIQTMGLLLRGINLVLVSNLTLRFESNVDDNGAVDSIHLDKTIHNKRQKRCSGWR